VIDQQIAVGGGDADNVSGWVNFTETLSQERAGLSILTIESEHCRSSHVSRRWDYTTSSGRESAGLIQEDTRPAVVAH